MWNCCRTCLKESQLSNIFRIPDRHLEYSDLLLKCTGIEIKLQDSLPQQMCEECITKINSFMEFRGNCFRTYKVLLNKVKNRETEMKDSKHDHSSSIMEHYSIDDVSVKEIDVNNTRNNEQYIEFEMSVDAVIKRQYEVVFQNSVNYKKVDLVYEDVKSKPDLVKQCTSDIVCKYCSAKFDDKIAMYNHYKTHTGKPVICEHCGSTFSTKKRLLVHCRAKHGYEKVDKCAYCDYVASNAESVKIHERTHTGERPFVCEECGAAFHRRSCYLQHLPIHLTQKTVQCEECSSMFKSVTLMQIHKARHRKRKR